MSRKKHKSGFVAILGKPNAGKSTLLNALLGQRISIITPKASTTRHRILGIDNGPDHQIVFSDTPGVIKPKYGLHRKMMGAVGAALEDADLIVLLIAMDERYPEDELLEIAGKSGMPILLVVNKIDLSNPDAVKARLEELSQKVKAAGQIALCATQGFNVEALREMILELLPEGPAYFDKDQVSDRPERFFAAELIREKIFLLLKEELPYSAEVEIEEFQEAEAITHIHAVIHVERDSQKAIILGKGGDMIRRIGTAARLALEDFLQQKVFLQLFVRVTPGWKDNERKLRGFGYE